MVGNRIFPLDYQEILKSCLQCQWTQASERDLIERQHMHWFWATIQSQFLVNYLHVAGPNLGHWEGDLLSIVCWIIITSLTYLQVHMDPHITDWITKPSQVPWTGNQPICQVVYLSVFCLHTLLRRARI